jgi:uncharacterized protein (TIGR02246 family)
MSSFLLIAWMSLFPVFGGSGTPLPKPTGAELEVHQAHQKYVEAWNKHDAKAMGESWAQDCDYTEPDGRTVFGREAVVKLLGIEHASVFKSSKLNLIVERVHFIKPDVAVADGSYELFGATDPRGRPIGVRSGYFTTVLNKQNGAWLVSAGRLMLPQVLIWRDSRTEAVK